jgi:DNA adenine methylase
MHATRAAAQVGSCAPAPFIKWAGGKGQLLAQLEPLLPPDVVKYHEPFVGGGALYFHLAPRAAELADANADLIATYQAVRDDVDVLLRALAPLDRGHSDERYYRMRSRWNERPDLSPVERAALFIYLNKTGYNGLWRVNLKGKHNVPVGRYTRPHVFDADVLRADARLLRGAKLRSGPFEHVLDRAAAGDFVYFDPPYHPISRTSSFTAYARGGFGEADQQRLASVFAELDRRGCRVMLSNSDCAFIAGMYRRWRIDRVRAARAINSKAGRRGSVSELVIRNYP